MTSKVDICNLALVEAKYDETIESFDEHSVAGERCKRLYDVCRKELLCSYPWSFASKRVKTPRVAEDIEGFKYAYSYPEDCLRVTNVYPDERGFKVKNFIDRLPENTKVALHNGEKVIVCDYQEPFIEYIYDEEVEGNFPQSFIRLLYLEMALRLGKLAGMDNDDLKLIAAQIQQAAEVARTQSNTEGDNHLVLVEDDYYINVRG
jgi:hypothetical protein